MDDPLVLYLSVKPNLGKNMSSYYTILNHYNECLARHGDTARGADWPNEPDLLTRYRVMADLFEHDVGRETRILDFACGTGRFLDFLRTQGAAVDYLGADLSREALAHARRKHPDATFVEIDVMTADSAALDRLICDYCVINGLFTLRCGIPEQEMWGFVEEVLRRLWPRVGKALAFNVMSKHVDWEREDLFHASFDTMAALLHSLAGRHLAFRADYGLHEYTCIMSRPSVGALNSHQGASSEESGNISVCRPLLPRAASIRPYLNRIDQSRVYSNFGELALRLERRLEDHFELGEGSCVSAANGSSAITAALLATTGGATDERPFCLMPSYTFAGTPAAASAAGFTPYFADVSAEDFLLSAEYVAQLPDLNRIGAIVVVGPYGAAVPQAPWLELATRHGISVVIDAAAGFDTTDADRDRSLLALPVCFSFHATKVFSTGEGGAVLSTDRDLVRRVRRALNFGMLGDRRIRAAGINGKMSEYHAALGHAELDCWAGKRAGFLRVAEHYRERAEHRNLVSSVLADTAAARSYVLFLAGREAPLDLRTRLGRAGVETRLWYGLGCHREPIYADAPRTAMNSTNCFAPRLIGLPMSVDMQKNEANRVVDVLAGALNSAVENHGSANG